MPRMSMLGFLTLALVAGGSTAIAAEFRAGAAAIDVTPEKFPVVVNGSFLEKTAASAQDRLHARALVLDDGKERLAIVVVDSCMMPREFLDRAKDLIAAETKIPTNRQLISATHTHTAPAVMGCLGSGKDPTYGDFLERQLVQVVRQANSKLASAKIGWAVADAGKFTNNRQWILRTDKVRNDPFGEATVRSNMHPGYEHPDFVGPSGPTDPWLSLIAIRTADDKPLAVLANFSMHYFGAPAVSADYFGAFCAKLEASVGGVAIMSQGTSGDLHWMDYSKSKLAATMDAYAADLARLAADALKSVEYRADVSLAMTESEITLNRRVPDKARLEWAKGMLAKTGNRIPTNQPEVYAREAMYLHEEPKRTLKLQAIRIGDIGIAAIPDETFALTGLKIKAQGPLPRTFTIELANGSEGYIPPPEQHPLGGYTTWPARTAALEVEAESKIHDSILSLLEEASGRPRRDFPARTAEGYGKSVHSSRPVGYWRLGELQQTVETDSSGHRQPGQYEGRVVFGLPGPALPEFREQTAINRAAHFAGGCMTARLPPLGEKYSVECWVWNGVKSEPKNLAGVAVSLGSKEKDTDVLAVGHAPDSFDFPVAPADFRTWTHLLYVRDGGTARLYRNGKEVGQAEVPRTIKPERIVVGSTADGSHGFQGRIAEVAVYDRILTADDAQARLKAAQGR